MAKHRKPKRQQPVPRRTANAAKHRGRSTPSLIVLGTTAAGLSAALVLSHATNTTADNAQVLLSNAAIGIGGRGDPTSANIPAKINGTVVPPEYAYIPVDYPAGFDIDNSVTAGVPVLDQRLTEQAAMPGQAPPKIVIIGYSEGALVADREKRNLVTSRPPGVTPENVSFVLIASANVQNGGIFSRFPDLNIPFFVKSNGPADPSEYDTTYYTNEYDPYADFPAYFNPLALANSLVAVQYVHPDAYYDTIDLTPAPAGPAITKTVTNTAGGTDTYVFVLADHLPLLAPVRQVFGVVGLTPLTEPLLGAIEPLLRLGVDMAYTDRLNLNPEVPVQFSLITPPQKIVEALAGVPGAIQQGASNVTSGIGSIPSSVQAPAAPTPPPSNNSLSANTKLASQPPKPPAAPSLTNTKLSLTKDGPTLNKVTDTGGKTTLPSSSGANPNSGSPAAPVTATPVVSPASAPTSASQSTTPSGGATPGSEAAPSSAA
jgi:hypothetical protein